MIYHSGIFLGNREARKSTVWKLVYILIGVGYPAMILVTIVATANHYWMDALIATVVTCLAFLCNKVFLAFLLMEDVLLWVLRVEKPRPTTGEAFRSRGGRL